MMKKILLAPVVLCLSLIVVNLDAQTVDEILSMYFKNTGGQKAWKTLHSMKMTGFSEVQGMEFPITVYSKRPNYEKLEVQAQGMQIVEAYDGTTAWTINPFQGITSATSAGEEMSREAAKKSFEDELLNYAAKGHKVEKLDDQDIEGTPAFQLKLIRKSGDEQIYFFDQQDYLPLMIQSVPKAGPMQNQTIETHLSDYRRVEDLLIPHTIKQKANGQVLMQASIQSVELNPEITDDIFAFPVAAENPTPANLNQEAPVKKDIKPERRMMEDQPKVMEKKKKEGPVKH
jgi:outer membrane lipoprotein-sorting protein